MNNDHLPELGRLMTVTGPIAAEAMGVTLPHEHLLITHQGPFVDLTDEDLAADELLRFKREGGTTVVDMTDTGIGRDARALKRIAERTGVNVVMSTGFYKDAWLSPQVREMSVEAMAELMVKEIVEGVDGSGIRAGNIGEIGVSRPMCPVEEKALVASAHAQRRTGAAISVHFDVGTLDEHTAALDILDRAGANLNRVVVDHLVCRPDEVQHFQALAERGCYVEFELWGMHLWAKVNEMMGLDMEAQVASLRWFVLSGHLDRILISQDVCNQLLLVANGGYGYGHILRDLVPKFRDYGITEKELNTIMVDNPRRLFPFQFS